MRLVCLSSALVCVACGASKPLSGVQPAGYLDVKLAPYNAKGDGTTDDTAAIQKALSDTGAAGGGIVLVPTGRYRIKTHLSIPSATTLKGIFDAPADVDGHFFTSTTSGPGSMLLAEEGAGSDTGTPFVSLDGHDATIDGFLIFYPNQTLTNPPVQYPYSIAAGVDPGPNGPGAYDVNIQNIVLVNSYDGIDLGTHESTRHYVNNVYGQPEHIGIFVDQCYDVGRIENVQFNGNWAADSPLNDYIYQNGTAFLFYRSDAQYMSNVFAWGYHIGMQFQHSPAHDDWATYALIDNLGLENSDVAIMAINTAGPITINNFDYATPVNIGQYRTVVWMPADGATQFGAGVSLVNAAIANGYKYIARLEQVGAKLSLTASTMGPTSDTSEPLIDVLGGQAIVTGNNFPLGAAAYPLLHVAASAGQVVMTDNLIGLGEILIDPGATETTAANNQSVP